MAACRGDLQRAFRIPLPFNIGKIQCVIIRGKFGKRCKARRQFFLAADMTYYLAYILCGKHIYAVYGARLRFVAVRNENSGYSLLPCL